MSDDARAMTDEPDTMADDARTLTDEPDTMSDGARALTDEPDTMSGDARALKYFIRATDIFSYTMDSNVYVFLYSMAARLRTAHALLNLRRAYFYPSTAKAPTQKYQDYRAAQGENKSRVSDIL